MKREEYDLIKKLSPETLQELYNAIYEYNCHSHYCKDCPLSLDGSCVVGYLIRDKVVDSL